MVEEKEGRSPERRSNLIDDRENGGETEAERRVLLVPSEPK